MKKLLVLALILSLTTTSSLASGPNKSIFTPKKKAVVVPDDVRVRMRAFLSSEASLVTLQVFKPVVPVNPDPPPAPVKGACTYCDGTGKSGDGLNVCSHCNGTGREPKSMSMEEMLQHIDEQLDTRLELLATTLTSRLQNQLNALLPKPKEEKAKTAAPRVHYPIRGHDYWTGCGGWKHLTTGEHAGKFDPEWLKTLSNDEIQSLHSDHHDEIEYKRPVVHWDHVVKPQMVEKPAAPSAPKPAAKPAPARPAPRMQPMIQPRMQWFWPQQQRGNCPGGFCPASLQVIEVTDDRGYVIVENNALK